MNNTVLFVDDIGIQNSVVGSSDESEACKASIVCLQLCKNGLQSASKRKHKVDRNYCEHFTVIRDLFFIWFTPCSVDYHACPQSYISRQLSIISDTGTSLCSDVTLSSITSLGIPLPLSPSHEKSHNSNHSD